MNTKNTILYRDLDHLNIEGSRYVAVKLHGFIDN